MGLRNLNVACLSLVILSGCFFVSGRAAEDGTFTNPIFEGRSADPAVLFHEGFYYMTLSTDGETSITIYKSPVLTNFRGAESMVVYRAKNNETKLWASEIHAIDGNVYIYFAMEPNGPDHRMFVIQAENPQNPLGNWTDRIQLMDDWDWFAIDGTIMRQNGSLYFLYASTYPAKPPDYPQLAILIAPMRDPLKVLPGRTVLRSPKADWECCCPGFNGCIDEGPYFIYNQNVSYMVFSASGSFTPRYCLGMMSINSTLDPMNDANWNFGEDNCVFERNQEESVYSPGHATFTTSPDGTETWMVYHASDTENVVDRIARLERIDWAADGSPIFPKAHGRNHSMPLPSGQKQF